jgi:F5/8 type C domain-containing protein
VRSRATIVGVAWGMLVGIALRLWVASAADGKSFSDNAVVALMAMHALRGKLYTFYWGQTYMGSIEALVVAPFFALFGVSDRVLSAGLLPWWIAFATAVFLVVRRCAGDRAGAIAVALCALAPAELQFFEITPRGGYPATLAFGTTLLWLVLRRVYEPMPEISRARHVVAIGALAGLAFWTNWLVLPYFVVVGLYLLIDDPRLPLRRSAWLALGAFLTASLPLWVYNWRHDFASFAVVGRPADAPSRLGSLAWALSLGIPNVLGVRDLHGVWLFGWAGRLFAVVAGAAVLAGLVALRRSWLAIVRGRIHEASPAAALYLLVIATVGVYVLTLPNRFQIGRYLLPIASSSIPLAAIGLAWLLERRPIAGVGLLVALLAFYAAQSLKLRRDFAAAAGRYTAGPIETLAGHLLRSGIRFAYADYSDAAVTTYFTEERVILADYEKRYYPLAEVDFRDPAIVLREERGTTAATTLEALDAEFTETRIPGYRVYGSIHHDGVRRFALPRDGWGVTASVDGDDANLVLDGDPWTYWSAPPGAARPELVVDLGAEQEIAGVYLALGELPGEAFHRLRVEVSGDRATWRLVKEAQWDFPATFQSDGQVSVVPDNVQMVLFAPLRARWLRLVLLDAFPERRWSVGELAILAPANDGRLDGVLLAFPIFSDPRSPEVLERRLRLEADGEPASNRALLELARHYRSRGDREHLAEVDRLTADRFVPQTLVTWRFGRDLVLVGYDWRALDSRRFEITYYWQAARKMAVEYAVYAHFAGPSFRFQDDYVLGAPARTTETWEPGEVVKEKRIVTLPETAPAGDYAMEVGVWDPNERRHLRIGWWGAEAKTLLRLAVDARSLRIENE